MAVRASQPAELISQLIILYLEQASGQSDKKWHSAKHKVENRTLLEINDKDIWQGGGLEFLLRLRCVLFIQAN